MTEISDPALATYQSTREEIIGQIAPLLSTRMNYYTAIVIGQSVRDLGDINAVTVSSLQNTYGSENIFEYRPGFYGRVMAESKKLVLLQVDVLQDQVKILSIEDVE